MNQTTYNFSKALENNIKRTYTYSHAKQMGYGGSEINYDPMGFFLKRLEVSPFGAFMELERYQYKNTLNALNRYNIPYTAEQERVARVYYDVTEKMKWLKSDIVHEYMEDDLSNTGIVRLNNSHILTTKETIAVSKFIHYDTPVKKTNNVLYKSKLNKKVSNSREQLEAVQTCLEHHVSCLIGGAGTGKSTVTASIIDQLQANEKQVAVLAPTHKAREALQGKLRDEDIKNDVRTIHSFVHNPSECDAIVIDEAGMLSTPLFYMLIRAYKGQQLVFVGDKNQLPPVDYGRPFELIQKKVKVAELKKNFRSESADIIALGKAILGQPYNENMQQQNIIQVETAEEAARMGAEVFLTFTNSDVASINEQKRIKTGEPSISKKFKIGEKIIAKTNQRGMFYNGQLFKVVGYNQIQNKETKKIINVKNWQALDYNFDYAYGLTIHRSQGSEWDTVAYQPSHLDTKNLAYVAVTRAKKKLIIIGGFDQNPKSEPEWEHIDINSI